MFDRIKRLFGKKEREAWPVVKVAPHGALTVEEIRRAEGMPEAEYAGCGINEFAIKDEPKQAIARAETKKPGTRKSRSTPRKSGTAKKSAAKKATSKKTAKKTTAKRAPKRR